ncbi:unnamed protein product [Amoebophrya sp. A120]|nr:unnamed protein product [Amoebophrya sp. A120]|eukprot:GSA120T00006673001.1
MSRTNPKVDLKDMVEEAKRVERRVVGQMFREQQADVTEDSSEFLQVFTQGFKPLLENDTNKALGEINRGKPLGALLNPGADRRTQLRKLQHVLSGSRMGAEALDRALNKVAILQDQARALKGNADGRPKLTVSDAELMMDNAGGTAVEGAKKTSNGCECISACGREQGMPFQWCRVDGSKACGLLAGGQKAIDPSGYDHRLYAQQVKKHSFGMDRGPQATSKFWDYCAVPGPGDANPVGPKLPPARVSTSHPGCTCVTGAVQDDVKVSIAGKMAFWKNFFQKKYDRLVGKRDFLSLGVSTSSEDSSPWITKIPLRDRLAVVLAGQYSPSDKPPSGARLPAVSEQVCRSIPGFSNGFSVCPVEMSCLDGKFQENDHFLGRHRWTWDYCAVDQWGGPEFMPLPNPAELVAAG